MRWAIEQARAGIAAGQTPFGSVIVAGDEVIAANHNEVWLRTDPTAHAEIVAIQAASDRLGRIDLSGCTLYSTCEPCPMCAAAIHWAKVDAVHYGATIADAQHAGFTELTLPIGELYRIGQSEVRVIAGTLSAECTPLFSEWLNHRDHRAY